MCLPLLIPSLALLAAAFLLSTHRARAYRKNPNCYTLGA